MFRLPNELAFICGGLDPSSEQKREEEKGSGKPS